MLDKPLSEAMAEDLSGRSSMHLNLLSILNRGYLRYTDQFPTFHQIRASR